MRKQFVRLLSTLFPKRFAKQAFFVLTHPQVKKLRPRELTFLETAEKGTFPFHEIELVTYAWPRDGIKVLLIHGWEGQAGNFAEIIQDLQEKGFNVLAFDAPAHGFSPAGETTLWAFSEAVEEVINDFQPDCIISHSFGAVAATVALQRNQFKLQKFLMLCPPDRFSERIDQVSRAVGISSKAKNLLKAQLQREIAVPIEEVNVSQFVQSISVQQALILHDKADQVIPMEQSLRIAHNWKVAKHETIKGTGHFRLLRDENVRTTVLAFLSEE